MVARVFGWVVLVSVLGACDGEAPRHRRGGSDAEGAGAPATGGGGALATSEPSGGAGGGGTTTASGAGGSAGGASPSCDGLFAEPCGGCLAAACCAEVSSCVAAPGCFDCVTGQGAAGCDVEPAAEALLSCAWTSCQVECFDDPGGGGGSPGDGVGSTVAECQGQGDLIGTLYGEQLSAQSGFAGMMQGELNVFLFDRPFISALNLPGNPGEYKMRLVVGGSLGGNEYGGLMGVSKWDVAQAAWVDLAAPTFTVVVTVTAFGVVDPAGLMCNGKLVGHAEAVFDGNIGVGATFDVPVLTPDFP